jgi:hypothetical protein
MINIKKYISYLPLFLPPTTLLTIQQNTFAVEVVMDFETHKNLNNINTQQIKQAETLNKINKDTTEIKESLTGIYSNATSTVNNETFNQDISNIKTNHTLKNTKTNELERELDNIFKERDFPTKEEKLEEVKHHQQTQEELRQSIIYSSSIINSSKTRNQEIESLVSENGRTETLKQSTDLLNKIAIEILTETKRNNILLSLLLRTQTKEKYKGQINITQEQNNRNNNNYNQNNSESLYRKLTR